MRTALCIMAAILLAAPRGLLAGEVVEKFDSGKTRLKYATNAEGQKNGDYVEYYESGRPKVKASYKADKLQGLYTEYFDSAAVRVRAAYVDGQRHGGYQELDEQGRLVVEQIFWKGEVLYPRSPRLMKQELDLIHKATGKEPGQENQGFLGPMSATDSKRVDAVRRLNAYRYLAGVPHDVTLKLEYCEYAEAAAEICARIGRLDHNPPNPGMPEEQYQKALTGARNANLHMGAGIRSCVDGFMDDSDPRNIVLVGHRRWCLNPAMGQAGFGDSGKFAAMYAHDASRRNPGDYDFVAFPAPGYMPTDYFGAGHAWSVSVNPRKYRRPEKGEVKVAVRGLAPGTDLPEPGARGPELELEGFNVDNSAAGIPNAIIFRPKRVRVMSGARYWVEIGGLKRADGSEAALQYLVEFINL